MSNQGLSVIEAAARLGISKISAYRLIRSNKLQSIKLGGRRIVPLSAVEAILSGGSA